MIVSLFVGLGVFLLGLKLMSDGLERAASGGMRKMFGKLSNNVAAGIATGTAATAIIQSSSATTVMVVGFVNAGIMTLYQAAGIIFGANIGTTVTGFLVAFSSIKISLYVSFLAFAGIAMVLFFKKDQIKNIGWVLTGLGIIFVGLDLMSGAVKSLTQHQVVNDILQAVTNPFLLILIGTLVTGVLQSSSAVNGLLIVLVGEGGISLASGLYLVLGTNIGTCITAILASMGASTNAKRAAVMHLMFNVIGTVLFLPVMLPFSDAALEGFMGIFGRDPRFQFAWFNLFRNLIPAILMIPFTKPFVRLAEFLVKDKQRKSKAAEYKFKFIDERFLSTPAIAVAQITREILDMSAIASQNFELAMSSLINRDVDSLTLLEKNEKQLNNLNNGITDYLVKVTSTNLNAADERLIGSYFHVVSDLERIGDHSKNIMEYAQQMTAENFAFSDDAVAELKEMYETLKTQYADALKVFSARDHKLLKTVAKREDQIDKMKDVLSDNHVERLNKGVCVPEKGMLFYGIITDLERIADHLMNIAQSIDIKPAPKLPTKEQLSPQGA